MLMLRWICGVTKGSVGVALIVGNWEIMYTKMKQKQ